MEKVHDNEAGLSKAEVFTQRIFGDNDHPVRKPVAELFDALRGVSDCKFKSTRATPDPVTGEAVISEVELDARETVIQLISQLENIALVAKKITDNKV
jgi:hypothetical protein